MTTLRNSTLLPPNDKLPLPSDNTTIGDMDVATGDNHESLFSFEVFVESVSSLTVECRAPAVGFRLLDYPTQLVYFLKHEQLEAIRKAATVGDQAIKDPVAGLRDPTDGSYVFKRGKSCLLKNSLNNLSAALHTVPLYVLLMDAFDSATMSISTPKLLAHCSIPLLTLADQVHTGPISSI